MKEVMFDRKVQLPPPNRPKQLDAHTLPYIDANIILKCFFGKVGKINTSEKRRQSVKLRVYSHCSADLLRLCLFKARTTALNRTGKRRAAETRKRERLVK